MRNVNRIDTHNTHGWFVRSYFQGLEISCFLSDKKYNGEGKAKERARDLSEEWADWADQCRSEGVDGYDWLKEAKEIKTTFK